MLRRRATDSRERPRAVLIQRHMLYLGCIQAEQGRLDHARNHLTPAHLRMRDHDLDWVAVHKHPGHAGKGVPDERQVHHTPAIELDEEVLFPRVTTAPERAHYPLEPGTALLIGDGWVMEVSTQHRVNRLGLRDDNRLWQRGQHLRDQRRSAARHVEDEPGWGQTRLRLLVLGQRIDRRLVAEEPVERMPQARRDGLLEKWLAEAPFAQVAPLDHGLRAAPPHTNRDPYIELHLDRGQLSALAPLAATHVQRCLDIFSREAVALFSAE